MRYSVSRAALAAALVLMPATAMADPSEPESNEEVIVTATRADDGIPVDQYGGSATVIDPQDLDLRQARIISDVLRDVPGIEVNRSGGVGGLTQVRMRGAESNHTLVLIDGMDVSDPYQGEFDFATLIADDVARVEVLRGPQSALYGSDAIGGVINYQTLSGAEAPGISGRVEGGSFGTFGSAVRAAGVAGAFDYAISADYQTTDGTPTSFFGNRDVGASNGAIAGRFAYQVSDNFKLRLLARYSHTAGDTNPQDFNDFTSPTYGYVIDGDGIFRVDSVYGLVGANLSLLGGAWTHDVSVQGTDSKRKSYSTSAFDLADGRQLDAADDGTRIKASYVTAYNFGNDDWQHTLTGAVDYTHTTFQNQGPFLDDLQAKRYNLDNTGLVAQYNLLGLKKIGFSAAVRYDENERFENATTYNVQGSYLFDSGTRLHAATGSGIAAPEFFELFGFDPGNFVGNPNLKAERSDGWEAGVEQTLFNNTVRLDATYFDTTLHDEIVTDFSNYPITTVVNATTDSKRRGVELSAQAIVYKTWRIFAAYTYLDARQDGAEEVRRPPYIASLNVAYVDPQDRFSGGVTVRYNGPTFDSNFTNSGPARIKLDEFTLVNLDADVKITDQVRVYGRIENVFDVDYQEVYTYRSPGRAVYGGVKVGF